MRVEGRGVNSVAADAHGNARWAVVALFPATRASMGTVENASVAARSRLCVLHPAIRAREAARGLFYIVGHGEKNSDEPSVLLDRETTGAEARTRGSRRADGYVVSLGPMREPIKDCDGLDLGSAP